jgi:hypothetical protein
MARPVKQGIDVGDAHAFGAGRYLDDFVTGLQLAFFKNPTVKTRPAVRDQQRGHLWLVQPNTDAIAGDARLRDFEQRAADPIAVADAHVVIGQPVNGKVFPELPMRKVISAELLLPELIRLDLIDENRPLLAPMPGESFRTLRPVGCATASCGNGNGVTIRRHTRSFRKRTFRSLVRRGFSDRNFP